MTDTLFKEVHFYNIARYAPFNVSGMTDSYALTMYQRLFGISLP